MLLLLDGLDARQGRDDASLGLVDVEPVIALHDIEDHDLAEVLQHEGDERVEPAPHGEKAVVDCLAEQQAGDGDLVLYAGGPEQGQHGGHGQRQNHAQQQDARGHRVPEGLVARAAGEDGEEVGQRELEKDEHDDLPVVHSADPDELEYARRVPAVQTPPDEQNGRDVAHEGDGRGHHDEHGHVPQLGYGAGLEAVVGDHDERDVVENGDEHDEQHRHREERGPGCVARAVLVLGRLEREHGDKEEEEQLQRGSDTVRQEGLHALEDLARDLDTDRYGAQALLGENDVSGRACSLSGALNSNACV